MNKGDGDCPTCGRKSGGKCNAICSQRSNSMRNSLSSQSRLLADNCPTWCPVGTVYVWEEAPPQPIWHDGFLEPAFKPALFDEGEEPVEQGVPRNTLSCRGCIFAAACDLRRVFYLAGRGGEDFVVVSCQSAVPVGCIRPRGEERA